MAKFRVGDRVKCVKRHSDGPNTGGMGHELGKEFVIASVQSYGNTCYFPERGSGVYENYLELVHKTFETLSVGDIVYPSEYPQYEKEVLFANGEVIITRDTWDGSNDAQKIDADEFEDFVIKGNESTVKELTLEEIATKFGIDVKNVRIKE